LTAVDGETGVKCARRELPHLIICDMQLPDFDGCEVARRLKSVAALKEVPLLAVTALAMVGDRERVLKAGFNGYISKPIDPESFMKQIEAHLDASMRSQRHVITQDPPGSDRPAAEGAPIRGTILVIDDFPANLTLFRCTFEPSGYDVHTASTLSDGLAKARHHLPDVIVSDLHVHGENGFDFLRSVRSDSTMDGIPFIFLSASADVDRERMSALALGAARFIRRPIDPQALLKEVESCMRERQCD
jgi:two-component system cell cycle response regulator